MTAWLAGSFVGSTLLMLVVLALRGPVARAFGARWAYALWLVPAMRLVLPPLPDLFPKAPLPPVVLFIPTTADLAAPPPAEMATSWEWMPFLLALWAGGAVIFLTLQWLGYREFLHRLAASARPGRPPAYGGIRIFSSPEVEGPVALGLLQPRIIVPSDFLRRYSPGEQRLAMEHELVHHRRRDMWWNLAALIVLAFNWFNPVAWIAFRAFRNDQELACDAAVAAGASPAERHDYATAMVKAATRPGLIAACPLTRTGELKHRLRMMRSHRISRLRSAGGAAAMSILAVGALSLASGTTRADPPAIVYAAAPSPAAGPRPLPLPAAQPAAAPRPAPQPTAAAMPRHGVRGGEEPAATAPRPADPLILAAAAPVALPAAEAPGLAPANLQLRRTVAFAAPRRVVRIPAPPRVRVYTAATTTPADPQLREKVEFVARLIARFGDDQLSESDMADLQAALENARGHVKIKVMHEIIRENGA